MIDQPSPSQPTWTLSGFGDEIDTDPEIQLAVLQALGASHIELRSAWGVNVVDLDDEQLQRIERLLTSYRMEVSAIASPIGKVDVTLDPGHEVTRLKRVIHVAHRLGASYIRIFSFYRSAGIPASDVRSPVLTRMRALADVAESEDVVLVHENEKEIYGDTPDRVLDIVESVGSHALKLAWDSANFVQVGVAPFTDAFDKLHQYVDYLQLKDARAPDGVVVPVGEGDGELRPTLESFRNDGYSGFASLEPHLHESPLSAEHTPAYLFGIAARAFRGVLNEIGVVAR